ncbi:MAG: tRNA guanosine(34) transglycosylase Tgt [Pelagibacterales bacterium]|nr:tRNA guanosine(34) transglycosylase Tgt [Pelagibacterales bacterium]OUU61987.1 MAG: tRNA guanosine(34) transglycosylase Tgt [Alphaproteobacteria bacterium TMED62]
MNFKLLANSGKARVGQLITKYSTIETPVFMPVGTLGTVKGITKQDLYRLNFNIILSNTYHLMLRPGLDVIKKIGGLNKFMSWDKSILTDSGGFQVMSLGKSVEVDKNGVTFRSHIDGKLVRLDAEKAMDIQYHLGSTISMIFDECVAYPSSYINTKESLTRSIDWSRRSRLAYRERDGHGAFGIVQGGMYKDLRKLSVKENLESDFDGYAIGGLAVGEEQDQLISITSFTADLLPENKPRYLMGVGYPEDILKAVKSGIDMFDCVLPTRSGRTGLAFTSLGNVKIKNAKYAYDNSALDPNCNCIVCSNYSKAYLHHLVKSSEILGSVFLSYHNLCFYSDLMKKIRSAIKENNLNNLKV